MTIIHRVLRQMAEDCGTGKKPKTEESEAPATTTADQSVETKPAGKVAKRKELEDDE